jgi:hypothetical protein
LPINVQRRLPDGIWVAWIILVMVAVEEWLTRTDPSQFWRRWLPFVLLCLLFLSTFFLLAGGIKVAIRAAQPLFRPVEEVELFEWIRSNANPGSVVLTSYETGNPLPAWAPARVLVGLGPESIDLAELLSQVKSFFSSATSDEQRQRLLVEFDVAYVFYGPAERVLGDWNPSQANYLELDYVAGEYSLFRVVP